MSMMGQLLKPKMTEITEKLRAEINKVVNKYIDQGVAELVPGVLFIDETHGIPSDLLARLLIIPTNAYEADENQENLRIRVTVEGLAITEAALDKLTEHARVSGRNQIDVQDVGECEDLFIDARRSAAIMNGEAGNGFIS
ncbi:uncharacterized protein EAF02_002229 [Botrytis sinoallii]|uniref:uncharacterized protein n=1 Tax=Botrytis sinoallii TaxID=1463999 RepID=UPI001900BBC2|nr:uncharacterized protein EAF02_002229 [Botrytis sinoallii]KAF7889814.1 hypothetical protein EAF02_002229 [Botrytis sinoallii]